MIRFVLLVEITDVKWSPKHMLIALDSALPSLESKTKSNYANLFLHLGFPLACWKFRLCGQQVLCFRLSPVPWETFFGSLLGQGKWVCDSSLSVNDVKGQSQSMPSNSNSFKAQFLRLEWKSEYALDCHANPTTCLLRKGHCYCAEGERAHAIPPEPEQKPQSHLECWHSPI